MNFVERPGSLRRPQAKYPYDAIIETATNGKAVLIPVDPEQAKGAAYVMRRGALIRGYALHTRNRPEGLYVWASPLATQWGPEEPRDP